jgi:hypothetical protein
MTRSYRCLRNLTKRITQSQASRLKIEMSINNPKTLQKHSNANCTPIYPSPKPSLRSMAPSALPAVPRKGCRKNRAKRSNPLSSASSFIDPALHPFTGHSVVTYYSPINTIYGGIHYILLDIRRHCQRLLSSLVGRLANASTRADKSHGTRPQR